MDSFIATTLYLSLLLPLSSPQKNHARKSVFSSFAFSVCLHHQNLSDNNRSLKHFYSIHIPPPLHMNINNTHSLNSRAPAIAHCWWVQRGFCLFLRAHWTQDYCCPQSPYIQIIMTTYNNVSKHCQCVSTEERGITTGQSLVRSVPVLYDQHWTL